MNAEVIALLGSEAQPAYANVSQVIRALQPLEPCYLYSEQRLDAQARRFLAGFPGLVTYAVKANCQTQVLHRLWQSGVRAFDVASIAEIALLHSVLPQATLHFNNPIRPERDTHLAYEQYGIRSFAVDDELELDKLKRVIQTPEAVELSIRFALGETGACYDFASKFGAPVDQAVALLREAKRAGFRCALSFHPGSQCTEINAFVRHIQAAAEIQQQAGVEIERLNVGGGFAAPYLSTELPPLEDYFEAIECAVKQSFPYNPPALLCEPGRGMVASCCHLLCQVSHVRSSGEIFINDGVYGGLMEQAFVDIDCPITVWRGDQPLRSLKRTPRWIFGPTCDSVDRLSRQQCLPDNVAVGDWLEFHLMGAYASVTATRFNGFKSLRYIPVDQL